MKTKYLDGEKLPFLKAFKEFKFPAIQKLDSYFCKFFIIILFYKFITIYPESNILRKEEAICPICLYQINNEAKIFPCNHFFCKNCIKKWYRMRKTCPYCRQKIKRIQFHL